MRDLRMQVRWNVRQLMLYSGGRDVTTSCAGEQVTQSRVMRTCHFPLGHAPPVFANLGGKDFTLLRRTVPGTPGNRCSTDEFFTETAYIRLRRLDQSGRVDISNGASCSNINI